MLDTVWNAVQQQRDFTAHAHLLLATCLAGASELGVKAVTLATELFLPVDEGGLGPNVPLGDAPAVRL